MSHSVEITLIADQEIQMLSENINIHDIDTITLNSIGIITNISVKSGGVIIRSLAAPDELISVMTRAIEIADRRGIDPLKWIAEAIWYKNELEAGQIMDERRQGEANEP